jgi:sporulation protein YlmC with PRC-barrel domain
MTKRYLAVAVSLVLTPAAFAQDQPAEQRHEPPASAATSADASKPASAADARKLVGKTVQTASGETLGKVSDVLVDEGQGGQYVLIAYGDKRFAAVPLERARSMMKKDVLVLDRDQLEKAPALKDQEWRKADSGNWNKMADRYWAESGSEAARSAAQDASSSTSKDRL